MRLINVGTNWLAYDEHKDYYNIDNLDNMFKYLMELGIKETEIEIALSHLGNLAHNYASFGVRGTFIASGRLKQEDLEGLKQVLNKEFN